MRRNKETAKKYDRNKKGGRRPNTKGRNARQEHSDEEENTMLSPRSQAKGVESRNHYLWYYFDEAMAEQVSRMSFQQLADMPCIDPVSNTSYKIPSVEAVFLNPSPGVQLTADYSSTSIQKSAINLSGFRLFSKMAAFTGRSQVYGPQDISTMELFMGEIISQFEWIRRAFGVAFASNMRNRAYPKRVLEAMCIDANDLFINFANYRTQFNALVTRINQIPIPLKVAYFDKCAKLYEGYYTDSESPMAQIIVSNIATTWELDETGYVGGTVLKTEDWCLDHTTTAIKSSQPMSYYLLKLSNHIDQLMNSSTFNVVYTDLLNLATKINMTFWKFDYLLDGYLVLPEFNAKYLIQFHNAVSVPMPFRVTALDATNGITPYNDVYPNPTANALYYNPGITAWDSAAPFPGVPFSAIIDSPVGDLDTETQVNITRYVAVSANTPVTLSANVTVYVDTALPDHYMVNNKFYNCDGTVVNLSYPFVTISTEANRHMDFISCLEKVDWSPLYREISNGSGSWDYTGRIFGDLNFWTIVDWTFIRKLHDFVGLALYDFRIGEPKK